MMSKFLMYAGWTYMDVWHVNTVMEKGRENVFKKMICSRFMLIL